MKTVKYDKLVRDKIPDIILQNGDMCLTKMLSDESYKKELKLKLYEEIAEYCKDNNVEELVDILELVYACAKTHGISPEVLEDMRRIKCSNCGAFDNKILLKQSTYKDRTDGEVLEYAKNVIDDYVDTHKFTVKSDDTFIRDMYDELMKLYKNQKFDEFVGVVNYVKMLTAMTKFIDENYKKHFDIMNENSTYEFNKYMKPFPDDLDSIDGAPNFGYENTDYTGIYLDHLADKHSSGNANYISDSTTNNE